MTKINLSELQRHATAYLPDENRRAHPAHIQAYYRHCGPEDMLALVRVARAARGVMKSRVMTYTMHGDDLKIFAELAKSIGEIEQTD